MAEIQFIKPCDQPTGTFRLLECLRGHLDSNESDDLRIIVAFAKTGPLLRLLPHIEKWSSAGKTIQAIFGIDLHGTSQQALDFALIHFNEVYIVHSDAPFSPTFHPKVYIFSGSHIIEAYIGSNNLTVGGTETNFETCTHLTMHVPEDQGIIDSVQSIWNDTLAASLKLDQSLLTKLINGGLLLDETQTSKNYSKSSHTTKGKVKISFPELNFKPASPIPAKVAKKKKRKTSISIKKAVRKTKTTISSDLKVATINARALVIQITPHHNGEVFLSKTAVDQDQAFFGWPFTGQTTPKKAKNPPYPQREPDPVVNISVINSDGNIILRHDAINLNTIYYSAKSEIRITVPPDVVGAVPTQVPYPIMVMSLDESHIDYDLSIYLPGSSSYNKYLGVCNQSMPSGGKSVPRKFGWL